MIRTDAQAELVQANIGQVEANLRQVEANIASARIILADAETARARAARRLRGQAADLIEANRALLAENTRLQLVNATVLS